MSNSYFERLIIHVRHLGTCNMTLRLHDTQMSTSRTCSVGEVAAFTRFRFISTLRAVHPDGAHHWIGHVATGWAVIALLTQALGLGQTARLAVPASRALGAFIRRRQVRVVRPRAVRTAERYVCADGAVETHGAVAAGGDSRALQAVVAGVAQASRLDLVQAVAVVARRA